MAVMKWLLWKQASSMWFEFCNNTVEPFGLVTSQFLEWPNCDTVINPHGSIKCGDLISESLISISRRTLLHDKRWIDWENTHTKSLVTCMANRKLKET